MQSIKSYQWVASLSFFQSLPFIVVSLIGTLIYQQAGLENTQTIFITSLLVLPWVVKPLFAPWLENNFTKKNITLFAQFAISLLFLILALSATNPYFLYICIAGFACIAMLSSVHDIVADGIYLLNLNPHYQKKYVGLRSFFFQLGRLFVIGGLLASATQLAHYFNFNMWRIFFLTLFIIGLVFSIYHITKLPHSEKIGNSIKNNYSSVIKSLLHTPKLPTSFCILFLYNYTETQMLRMVPLYLVDKVGMGLGLAKVGEIYGIFGSLSLMVGLSTSIYLLTQLTIERCLKQAALLICLGHLVYLLQVFYSHNMILLYFTVMLNQMIAGIAMGSYMGYMLSVANNSQYPMSMYTIGTGIMALSSMLFGSISGLIEQYLGYTNFFLYIFVINLLIITMTYKLMKNDA